MIVCNQLSLCTIHQESIENLKIENLIISVVWKQTHKWNQSPTNNPCQTIEDFLDNVIVEGLSSNILFHSYLPISFRVQS